MTPVLCSHHAAVVNLARRAISGHRRHKTIAAIADQFSRQHCQSRGEL